MTRLCKFFPVILLLLLTGCSTLYRRVDLGISEKDVVLTTYETHFHDVLDRLGPPSRMSAADDGLVFLYEDFLIRELQMGIGGREGLMQLMKLSLANSRLYRKTAILRFNQKGILISQALSETKEGLGTGAAIQPLISVQQIVETGNFEDDGSEPQRWGMDLLRPLPQTLNHPQSLDSGQGGLEQSGTTTKVGQHSLEMY